jgi:hypothetical protein
MGLIVGETRGRDFVSSVLNLQGHAWERQSGCRIHVGKEFGTVGALTTNREEGARGLMRNG